MKTVTWESYFFNGKKLERKRFEDYVEYVKIQKSKVKGGKLKTWLSKYDPLYYPILTERLKKQGIVKAGMNILCLGARIGTEVKAFLKLNCFAVGIDLDPRSKKNKYVLYGDFHDIQFPPNSVDVVFTNSLDHVLYLDKFLTEVKRVLKPMGYLILDVVVGKNEGAGHLFGHDEAIRWEKISDIVEVFTVSGFKLIKRVSIECPWKGEHVSLQLVN